MTSSIDPSSSVRFSGPFIRLAGTSFVFFTLILAVLLWVLRDFTRQQMLQGEADLLQSVAQQSFSSSPENVEFPDVALVQTSLETSELRGVVALRAFFPPDFLAFQVPGDLVPSQIDENDFKILQNSDSVIRWHPDWPLNDLFAAVSSPESQETASLLEVIIPVYAESGDWIAAIQFWIDGSSTAISMQAIDQRFTLLFAVSLAVVLIVLTLLFAYTRWEILRLADQLRSRTQQLLQSQKEQAASARASAVGAIAANLIHSLKNSLHKLRLSLDNESPQEARETTQELNALIGDTVSFIQHNESLGAIDFDLAEFVQILRQKLDKLEGSSDFTLEIVPEGDCQIRGKEASIALLIIRNLIENALQAGGDSGHLRIGLTAGPHNLKIEISDDGPGIPPDLQDSLFSPVTSTKPGGSGIGLVLSQSLAASINAHLALAQSSSKGTTFLLTIPYPQS